MAGKSLTDLATLQAEQLILVVAKTVTIVTLLECVLLYRSNEGTTR